MADLPPVLVERLRHYFTTYKLVPGEAASVTIEAIYGRAEAHRVILSSLEDYAKEFGGVTLDNRSPDR